MGAAEETQNGTLIIHMMRRKIMHRLLISFQHHLLNHLEMYVKGWIELTRATVKIVIPNQRIDQVLIL